MEFKPQKICLRSYFSHVTSCQFVQLKRNTYHAQNQQLLLTVLPFLKCLCCGVFAHRTFIPREYSLKSTHANLVIIAFILIQNHIMLVEHSLKSVLQGPPHRYGHCFFIIYHKLFPLPNVIHLQYKIQSLT